MNPIAIWLLCSFSFLCGFVLCALLIVSRNEPLPPSDVEQRDTFDLAPDPEITANGEVIIMTCDRR